MLSHVEKKKDPVEKSKAALSDLRKRIDERKRVSKVSDVKQYEERREESIPELTGVTFSESPTSERQEASPGYESPALEKGAPARDNFAMNASAIVPSHNIKNFYKDEDRYRKSFSKEEDPPPTHIEVRSGETPDVDGDDNDTEVSEITTDVRIISTRGVMYAERRMASNLQMNQARPSLSTSDGRRLERDININMSNLRQLGEAVEQAKMDLRKEMSPKNAISRHYGLPYEDTDYKPLADEDDIDSWGDVIRTDFKKRRSATNIPTLKEGNASFVVDKIAAKKLQNLVKEAYSYEGDVFIDATEVREEDIDADEHPFLDGRNHTNPITLEEECTLVKSDLNGGQALPSKIDEKKNRISGIPKDEYDIIQKSFDATAEHEAICPRASENWSDKGRNHEDIGSVGETLEDSEKKSAGFTNNPAAIASEIYTSSLGFLKSFSSQVDTQLKLLQERGLITKKDMDGMLGVLENDVKETEAKFSKDGDEAAIFLQDELDAPGCGADLPVLENNSKTNTGSKPETVDNMLESLKKSYNLGISKCGIDSDLIKENTKAIEAMVVNLQKAKVNSPRVSPNDASGKEPLESLSSEMDQRNCLKELSAKGVEDMIKDPIPLSTTKDSNRTYFVSVNMSTNK